MEAFIKQILKELILGGIIGVFVIIIIFSILENLINKNKATKKAKEIYKKTYGNTKYKNVEEKMEHIDNLEGYEFEDYIIGLLRKDGYTNIQGTKYSGDYGVDIIADKDGLKCAIQCKRFSNKVSLSAIQEISAGRKYYKCDKAIVITNNYYTNAAKELALAANVELLDRDYIIKILKKEENTINLSNVNNVNYQDENYKKILEDTKKNMTEEEKNEITIQAAFITEIMVYLIPILLIGYGVITFLKFLFSL